MQAERQHIRSVVIRHLEQRRKSLFTVGTQGVQEGVDLHCGQVGGLSVRVDVPQGPGRNGNLLRLDPRGEKYGKNGEDVFPSRHIGSVSEWKLHCNPGEE